MNVGKFGLDLRRIRHLDLELLRRAAPRRAPDLLAGDAGGLVFVCARQLAAAGNGWGPRVLRLVRRLRGVRVVRFAVAAASQEHVGEPRFE